VVLNSWSGQSGDVLDSLEFARAKGARTVGVVADSHSPLATDVDLQIPYDGRSIYEVPIVALLHFVMGLEGVGSMDGGLRSSVLQLPERLSQLMPSAASKGAEDADRLRTVDHIYVLGAGPCSSLGLKLANVLMENVRIGSAYYDTVEFRHGAVEALDRIKPVMLVLIGSDDSREISLGMRDFSIREGAEVVAYDSADYDLMEPLLAPLIMNSFTQWFVVYSALLRGITDLDQRVYMGTGKLPQDVRS
jgi:fructoselysine-6-P-deglycase FrlB-like protein